MKHLYENILLVSLSLLLIYMLDTSFSQPSSYKPHIIKKEKKQTPKQKEVRYVSANKTKEQFKAKVLPALQRVYKDLCQQYKTISQNLTNNLYEEEIARLKEFYKVQSDEALLMALKPHPKSIALAQAAIESAWGRSRFFKEANNLYGIWSYNKNKPRIAASQTRGEKTIWLKKYSSIEESIRDYYATLARSHAYKEFRKLKMQTDDPFKLLKKLKRYSELGEKYTKDLKKIIEYNKFYLYD